MKVLMIIPELATGGAQRSFMQLSSDLSEYYEMQIVIFNWALPVAYETKIPVKSLEVQGGGSHLMKMLNFWKRVKALKRLKQQWKPDISISFLEGADYVNLLSGCGEKRIISIRGSKSSDSEISGILGLVRKRILIPWLYRKADRIVTVSELLRKEMMTSFGLPDRKLSTIYNYYDIGEIDSRSMEEIPMPFSPWFSGRVLVSVGRLHPQKNHQFLIDLFPLILKKNEDIKLVIIGDGPLKTSLIGAARLTGLRTFAAGEDVFHGDYSIYFLGELKNPLPFLKRSALFLLPSRYEGFPNVLIEAMLCGLPVLAADCDFGPREIILPGQAAITHDDEITFAEFGVLLPKTDHKSGQKAWVNAITQMLTDNRLLFKYQEHGRDRAMAFAKPHVLSRWIEVIERTDG